MATFRFVGYLAVFVRIPMGVAGYAVVMAAGCHRWQCLVTLALLRSVTVVVGAAAIARIITVSRKVGESFGPIPSSNQGVGVLRRFVTLTVCPQFCVR
jgi:hypothetical protein